MMKRSASTAGARSGFTLIELLLVIAIIAIIAGVVIAAVSPRRNITGARDAERKHMEKQLSQALYARLIDEWELPEETPEGQANAKPICRQELSDAACGGAGGVSLSSLPPQYISAIPVDPVMPEDSNCTGYMVYQEVGRPRVYAANAGKLQGDTPDGMCGVVAGGQPILISRTAAGDEASGASSAPTLSDDGRYVVFQSNASDLVASNPNGRAHIFLFDRQTSSLTRISNDSSGTAGDNNSYYPIISGNGRYVAFSSEASNLVAGDTNNRWDVFVHDTQTGQTTRVSVASDGSQGNGHSPAGTSAGAQNSVAISDDGRYVAFSSEASNLVAGDTIGNRDIFVHDTQTGQTTRVSVASDGSQGDEQSSIASTSDDGRFVLFGSWATNLVAGDTNGRQDIFVHDTQTGQTTRRSIASDGTEGNGNSMSHVISGDGRYVVFLSFATNLVAGDTNGSQDIFVHDTQTGQTTRVSVASDGSQGDGPSSIASTSDDGRFVLFGSWATNLVAGDTNGVRDNFVHDRQTGQTLFISTPPADITPGPSIWGFISGDSNTIAYDYATGGGAFNIYLRTNWTN